MASIRKLGADKWRVVVDGPNKPNCKRNQVMRTVSARNEAEAKRFADDLRRRLFANPNAVESESVLVKDVFAEFMKAGKSRRLAPTTMQRYESLMRVYLIPSFGNLKLSKLRKPHILSAYDNWNERNVKARTLHHAHDLMRSCLNFAVDREIITVSPAATINRSHLPAIEKPKKTVLDKTQLNALLRQARVPSEVSVSRSSLSSYPAFYAAIVFAALTGARKGEVLAMRWSDVDLDTGVISIARSLWQVGRKQDFKAPKNGRGREFTAPSKLVNVLRSHRAAQSQEKLLIGDGYHDQGLIFAQPDGTPFTSWNFGAAFKWLVQRSGVPSITFHSLRRTYVSLAHADGNSLEEIGRRVGHSSIHITRDRYLSVYAAEDARAAMAFEGVEC